MLGLLYAAAFVAISGSSAPISNVVIPGMIVAGVLAPLAGSVADPNE